MRIIAMIGHLCCRDWRKLSGRPFLNVRSDALKICTAVFFHITGGTVRVTFFLLRQSWTAQQAEPFQASGSRMIVFLRHVHLGLEISGLENLTNGTPLKTPGFKKLKWIARRAALIYAWQIQRVALSATAPRTEHATCSPLELQQSLLPGSRLSTSIQSVPLVWPRQPGQQPRYNRLARGVSAISTLN